MMFAPKRRRKLMEAQLFLQKSIREKLDELREKNNQFSLRAFARILKVSPASLSEFLNGKRVLSPKMLKKLAENLCLPPEDIDILDQKIARDKKTIDDPTKRNKRAIQLKNDQYYLVADWHYYSILCLAEIDGFKEDYQWIAERLNTTAKKAKEAIERLLRLNLLTYDDRGNLILSLENELVTSEDIPNTSLKKRHSENFEAARESLYNDDVLKRDFSFATLAIDPEKLPKAKKMIREFQDQLFDFLESGEKTEVYEICMQMFPRTNIKKDKDYENYQ